MVAHQRFVVLCAEFYLFLVSSTKLEHSQLIPGPKKPPGIVDSMTTTVTFCRIYIYKKSLKVFCDFDSYMAPLWPPRSHHKHLIICPIVTPVLVSRCRNNFCQVSLVRRRQIAPRRRVLQMACQPVLLNTLRTGDANLRFYITTAQDGWRKYAFLTRAYFPCRIKLIFRHRASCILGQAFNYSPENAFYIFNQ